MPRAVDVEVRGLNAVLRALRAFPPEASEELREASVGIASSRMLPAWQSAASKAGPWAGPLVSSVRVKRDRVPSLSIGYARRAFSGGASSNMVRWPSSAGAVRPGLEAFARAGSGWVDGVGDRYKEAAMTDWGDALERVVARWNMGAV